MTRLDFCAICDLPRFCHDWRVFRKKRTQGVPFNGVPGYRPRHPWRSLLLGVRL